MHGSNSCEIGSWTTWRKYEESRPFFEKARVCFPFLALMVMSWLEDTCMMYQESTSESLSLIMVENELLFDEGEKA
jgi:hypothetical protein